MEDDKYYPVFGWMVNAGLKPSELLVLARINSFAGGYNGTLHKLAEDTGLSDSSVDRAVRILAEKGFISRRIRSVKMTEKRQNDAVKMTEKRQNDAVHPYMNNKEVDIYSGEYISPSDTHARVRESDEQKRQFEEFWNEYPKKQDKAKARELFKAKAKTQKAFDEIMAGLRRLNREDYSRREKRFVPSPARFLENEKWLDESQGSGKYVPDFIYAQERGEFDDEVISPEELQKIKKHMED